MAGEKIQGTKLKITQGTLRELMSNKFSNARYTNKPHRNKHSMATREEDLKCKRINNVIETLRCNMLKNHSNTKTVIHHRLISIKIMPKGIITKESKEITQE